MNISILGAGTWGTALGRTLALKNHRVCLWSPFLREVETLSASGIHPNLPDCHIPDSIVFTTVLYSCPSPAVMKCSYLWSNVVEYL